MQDDAAGLPRLLTVFLCHGSEDKPIVTGLFERLRADGVDPWLDSEKLLPGQEWDSAIRRAVRTSDAIIVCLSRRSVTKAGYVQKEIRFALDVADEKPEGTIFVIPLKLDDCDVPERLVRWQWVTYNDAGYSALLKALRARAVDCGLDVLPGDADSTHVMRARTGGPPARRQAHRTLYTTTDVQSLLRRVRNGALRLEDVPPMAPEVVVGVSDEALKDLLDRFADESRKNRELAQLLGFIGIREPYRRWQEPSTEVHCFQNYASPQATTMHHQPVSSSNIRSIGYDPAQGILEVTFHSGAVYRYFQIPEHLYRGFMDADSHGRYLDTHIKKAGFAYEQVR